MEVNNGFCMLTVKCSFFKVRGDRSCLRPETSRTAHNMKLAGKGSSGGLCKAFLSNIAVSSTAVDFSLSPYENMLKMNYDRELQQTLRDSVPVGFAAVNSTYFDPSKSYRVMFSSTNEWFILGQQSSIMGGMQCRTYCGVVPLMCQISVYSLCRVILT
ncbi:hypothetical protein KIN20_027921 [Parelaphostrongylus tenuis]|uniref:Alpha-1,3-mannosyl-glycoprotein 2-beta-N-acetylglucosaminyltransferase n=2 Tax=Parelaphostrongylus tenuis TaxID=148309 RepID=A0AAD5WED0_PARTN|nr:hypothetical protein KIN20_027921 [Parelaphostrongylus tenuis]